MKKFYIELCGCIVACIGTTATVGILLNIPVLVNWGFTFNVALPTSACLIFIGWSLFQLADDHKT